MSCEDCQILLDAYVDGELDLVRSLEIETHLETCRSCVLSVENKNTLGTALRADSLYYRPPAGLETKVAAALRRASPSSRRLPWTIVAVAASFLVVGVFVDRLATRGQIEDPAQAVLDSHLRSLIPGHLTDVQSTDQHTVKPWFNGKLDFSPPVTDLASQGFPLVGGRLDSIDGRTVAVLIYQRRQHVINVYLWPGSPDAKITTTSRQGYNLLRWTRGGFRWWIASDLNRTELDNFANLLRRD